MRPQKIANALLRPINPELTLTIPSSMLCWQWTLFGGGTNGNRINQQAAPDWSFAEQN